MIITSKLIQRLLQISVLLMFFCLTSLASQTGPVLPHVIYGPDNRKDYYDIRDPDLKRLADSTPALFRKSNLKFQGDRVVFPSRNYGQVKRLCAGEPFVTQQVASFCSGALVGPDLVLTAGHCVNSQSDCSQVAIGFDYRLEKPGDSAGSIADRDLYFCRKLEARKYYVDGVDYALLRLDRVVRDRAPIRVHASGPLDRKAELAVLGYPSGLPFKLTDQANVRDVKAGHFILDADTFAGNSGSPVINVRTLEIEGVLVRGDTDYLFDGARGCSIERHCTQKGCTGESATLASALARALHVKQPQPSIEGATLIADALDGKGRADVLVSIPEFYLRSQLVLELSAWSRSSGRYELGTSEKLPDLKMYSQNPVTFGFALPELEMMAWGGCKAQLSLKLGAEILETDQIYIRAFR
ncbi:MAG TPA: hypothetical protein DCS07_02280 [Bdellovibrionales bacterium]|nr:hypothetical protein [Bdellovibrionales bacterium]